jgi:hypothetical protein
VSQLERSSRCPSGKHAGLRRYVRTRMVGPTSVGPEST